MGRNKKRSLTNVKKQLYDSGVKFASLYQVNEGQTCYVFGNFDQVEQISFDP